MKQFWREFHCSTEIGGLVLQKASKAQAMVESVWFTLAHRTTSDLSMKWLKSCIQWFWIWNTTLQCQYCYYRNFTTLRMPLTEEMKHFPLYYSEKQERVAHSRVGFPNLSLWDLKISQSFVYIAFWAEMFPLVIILVLLEDVFTSYLHHRPVKIPAERLDSILVLNCACTGKQGLQLVENRSVDNCEAHVLIFNFLWPLCKHAKLAMSALPIFRR